MMNTALAQSIAPTSKTHRVFLQIASMQSVALVPLRFGLIIVLLWIGGLKYADYEADSIVPLVSNSPLMNFVYSRPAPEYKRFSNKEGEYIESHRAWQTSNRTYEVSHILGVVIVLIGLLIAVHPIWPQVATVGSALLILMACTTLSFLITTPEAWVPAAGDTAHGFPYLSGVGRLIVKDSIMLGAAFATMVDSANAYLRRKEIQQ